MIVSERPGTTRDSVDVQFELDGLPFLAIDTAGVKRKAKIRDNLDFYSVHRAERSIRRADVVLAVPRPHPGHHPAGQATGRLHRQAVQALHLRRQQVGPDGRRDRDDPSQGNMGRFAHVVQHAFRNDEPTCRWRSSRPRPARTSRRC